MSTQITAPVQILAPNQKSLVARMASHFNIQPDQFFATIKQTVMPDKGQGVTNEQIASFLIVADKYQLNPFTKEIYAFPTKGGGIQPVVGVDGWSTIINREPQFDGMEFEDNLDDKRALFSITCRMYRKDRSRPIIVTEYLSECKRGTEPWQKWPARMLRHKAMIQCARYAFGLSGIVDPDEAERMVEAGATSINALDHTQTAHKAVQELATKYIQQPTLAAAPAPEPEPEPAHEPEPEQYEDEEANDPGDRVPTFNELWNVPAREPMQAASPRSRR